MDGEKFWSGYILDTNNNFEIANIDDDGNKKFDILEDAKKIIDIYRENLVKYMQNKLEHAQEKLKYFPYKDLEK